MTAKVHYSRLILLATSLSTGITTVKSEMFCENPRSPRPLLLPDEPCTMPNISEEDITKAFEYASNQAKLRSENEEEFVKTDYVVPSNEVTLEGRIFPGPSEKAMKQDWIQKQFEDATRFLAKEKGLSESQATACFRELELPENEPAVKQCKELQEVKCQDDLKYRTADGSCNNLQNPNWGRSNTCYGRIMKEAYADGISAPRMGAGQQQLPIARLLSSMIDTDVNVTSKVFSHITVGFGQQLAHDMAGTTLPLAGKDQALYKCCPQNALITFPTSCFPIEIYQNDSFYSSFGVTCQTFVRATACSPDCKLGSPRRQVNGQTGFIDASTIYGPTEEQMESLRTKDPASTGGLTFQETDHGDMLPASSIPELDQCSNTMPKSCPCFQSGDERVNFQQGLTALHTIWHRLHNQIAKTLRDQYKFESGDIIFQETRRIVGAQLQVVSYKEFLPLLIGERLMTFYDLNMKNDGFTTYSKDVNPTVTTEFSTAPFRYGHSIAQNIYQEYGETGGRGDDIYLENTQFHPINICEGKMDSIVRGFFHQGFQEVDRFFSSALSNYLFKMPGADYGLDLVSINIQRGRDTGTPPYIELVKYCYDLEITEFEDLDALMTSANWKLLQVYYKHVSDIDLYIGGFMETHLKDSMVGPTFGCLIGLQFHSLKFGDRFYFEHENQTGSFTSRQLTELRKTRMSWIICNTSSTIKHVPLNAFHIISEKNPLISCEDIPAPDFSDWLEK